MTFRINKETLKGLGLEERINIFFQLRMVKAEFKKSQDFMKGVDYEIFYRKIRFSLNKNPSNWYTIRREDGTEVNYLCKS